MRGGAFILATKSKSKAQAKKDRSAIKKLRDLGLVRKADLRKKPTPAQKRAIRKYADVLSGKAAVVRPKNPKSYDKVFRRVGGNVIVPRRKGERVKLNKEGKITFSGKRRRGTLRRASELGPQKKRTVYAVPFARRGEVQWFRFPDRKSLDDFMLSDSIRGYRNYSDFVVEEEILESELRGTKAFNNDIDPEDDMDPDSKAYERRVMLDNRLEGALRRRRQLREAFTTEGKGSGYEG